MSRSKHADLRDVLVDNFPYCFCRRGSPKYPLKIGIMQDILDQMPELGLHRVRTALLEYTGGRLYLESIVEGASRFALDGDIAGIVTRAEAAHATNRLAGYAAQQEPPSPAHATGELSPI
jgi:sRNA-binding protein